MEKATLSVQELAAQLGISLPKAYELVKQPGFPVLKIGTRILIPVDAFKAWLISNGNQKRKYCSRACYDAARRPVQAG